MPTGMMFSLGGLLSACQQPPMWARMKILIMMMMNLMFTPHGPRLAPQLSSWQLSLHHEVADLERLPVGFTAPSSVTIHTISAPLHFS